MTPTEIIESVVAGAELLIATAAFLALRQTRGEIAANRQASERAEQHLLDERQRQARQRLAEQELQRCQVLAELTGAWQPNVSFSPLELGRIRAALDALPHGHLPMTESFWFDNRDRRRDVFGAPPPEANVGNDSGLMIWQRERAREELSEHMRCLVEIIADERP